MSVKRIVPIIMLTVVAASSVAACAVKEETAALNVGGDVSVLKGVDRKSVV